MKKLTLALIAAISLSGCGDVFAKEPTKQEKCEDLAHTAEKAMTWRQSELSSDILIGNEVNRPYHREVVKLAYQYDIEESAGDKLEQIKAYKAIVYLACMDQGL
ncbi:TPA: hypothetical protein NJ144_003585 [Vibrio parahaemolyticus]|nr:hypothetical protein [Vibrio parahaemolyticus]HCG6227667.1 hypothetical protein [Vibrio parahaemolyticus]HCG6951959.1 hypothetical protein [Vibrio parahaemolyticus]